VELPVNIPNEPDPMANRAINYSPFDQKETEVGLSTSLAAFGLVGHSPLSLFGKGFVETLVMLERGLILFAAGAGENLKGTGCLIKGLVEIDS